MHPVRKQRLKMVLLIVVAASVAVGLVTYALRENINLFYTPSQIASGEAPEGVRMRAGGMVVEGSVKRAPDSLFVEFEVTDGAETIWVQHTGILPDLFAEGEAVVATGQIDNKRIFQASEVLAKHDENYTPPEVADAMKTAHERSGYDGKSAQEKSHQEQQ